MAESSQFKSFVWLRHEHQAPNQDASGLHNREYIHEVVLVSLPVQTGMVRSVLTCIILLLLWESSPWIFCEAAWVRVVALDEFV